MMPDPGLGFTISRFFTIIGGAITLLGGYGLYYYGNLKETASSEKISSSQATAELAKADAAKANSATAALQLDVENARQETSLAKRETEGLKLKVEEARVAAETARVRAEELRLEAESAKLERLKLQQAQNYVKSLAAQIDIIIPTGSGDTENTQIFDPTMLEKKSSILIISKPEPDRIQLGIFFLQNYIETQNPDGGVTITLNYDKAEMIESVYGAKLSVLDGTLLIECLWSSILGKYNNYYGDISNLKARVKIFVNGIASFDRVVGTEDASQYDRERLYLVIPENENNVSKVVSGDISDL